MGEGVPNDMDRELFGLQTRLGSLRIINQSQINAFITMIAPLIELIVTQMGIIQLRFVVLSLIFKNGMKLFNHLKIADEANNLKILIFDR